MKLNQTKTSLPLRNKISRVAYSTYFVIVLLFLGIRLLSAFNLLNFMPTIVRNVVSSIFIQIILMFSIALFMFSGLMKRKPKEVLRYYGFKKIGKKAWVYAILLGVVVFFLNSYIASIFGQFLEAIGFRSPNAQMTQYPWWLFILNIFLTALLPAVCEETAHRGLLLRGSLGFGATKAIIISGLLFGLMHMNINQFFYATIIGFYLGYLAIHSDSIIPGIVIHFINNALSTLLTFSAVNDLGFVKIFDRVTAISSNNPIIGIIFNGLFVALLVILFVMLTKKLITETSEKRVCDLEINIGNDLIKKEYIDNLLQSQKALQGESDLNKVEYIDIQELYLNKNIELGYMTELDKEVLFSGQNYKPDHITNLTLAFSFIVGIAVTIFTLVWGLL